MTTSASGLIQIHVPRQKVAPRRVLLLTAPRPRPNYTPLHFGDNRAPQGLGYVAAYLEKFGHEVKIVDLYTFTWKYRDIVREVESPWRRHKDTLSGRNWARTMEGDLKTVEGHSRGGFAQNNSDGTMEVGTDLEAEINSFRPDYLGWYIHSMSYRSACELSTVLKRDYPDIPQMCGGPHPTVLPEMMPSTFDYVVVGEGETAALDIIEGRAPSRIVQGTRVVEMNELVWPNLDAFWDLPYNWSLKLFGKSYIHPVVSLNTSRGCPFPCRFCGVQDVSGKRFRHISADRIFSHMQFLKDKYGMAGAYFREDNYTVSLKRVEEFCDLLVESGMNLKWACESRVNKLTPKLIEKMAKSGCVGLYVGVESGSDRMLSYMEKGECRADFEEKFPILHANNIGTYTTWIYGSPTETPEDRRMTDDLIRKIKPTTVDAFAYLGIPKSNWYRMIEENKEYEFIDESRFIYPKGYLGYIRELYGEGDGRVEYVERIYQENGVNPHFYPW